MKSLGNFVNFIHFNLCIPCSYLFLGVYLSLKSKDENVYQVFINNIDDIINYSYEFSKLK